jgi:hypothetical protein
MADLSNVVSFLGLLAPGKGARDILDFRGPGRLAAGLGTVMGLVAVESDWVGSTETEEEPCRGLESSLTFEAIASPSDTFAGSLPGSLNKGHFFASGESSGTSTISLVRGPEKLVE